jgi:catechol 2,3-dioxygenase-like lactoylglutathione lyase family enzyme
VLDHFAVNVSDHAASRAFYEAALKPLGLSRNLLRLGLIEPTLDFPGTTGAGEDRTPEFYIGERGEGTARVHIAFASPDRATVDAFHAAALAAGGRDNGAPGLREYHEHYYAAFVLDPDGNNVEAVCHRPED